MTVSKKSLGDTFEEYAENGMLGNARGRWSAEDLELKLRFPSLSLDSLLLHAPPLQLIEADPDPQQFSALPAEQVMRLHADAWEAAQSWPDGAALVSIRLEPDEEGWLRLIPVWSE